MYSEVEVVEHLNAQVQSQRDMRRQRDTRETASHGRAGAGFPLLLGKFALWISVTGPYSFYSDRKAGLDHL